MTYDPNPQGLVPFYSYILDVLLGTVSMDGASVGLFLCPCGSPP